MKRIFTQFIICVIALLSMVNIASADAVYPWTSPTYIPTAVSPLKNYTAPADYGFTANNIDTVTLQVTGTCTSLAGVVQGTNQAGTSPTPTWTTLNAWPVVSGGTTGAAAASIGGTGIWRIDTAGFAQLRLHITALTATCNVMMSGTTGSPSRLANVNDPCQDYSIPKSSVALNQGASATTAVVAAVAGKITYVCGFVATAAGTSPTFNFTTGTHVSTDCDTGAAVTTGSFIPSATDGVVTYAPGMTAFISGAVSRQVCLTTAATTSVQGILTYVQQ